MCVSLIAAHMQRRVFHTHTRAHIRLGLHSWCIEGLVFSLHIHHRERERVSERDNWSRAPIEIYMHVLTPFIPSTLSYPRQSNRTRYPTQPYTPSCTLTNSCPVVTLHWACNLITSKTLSERVVPEKTFETSPLHNDYAYFPGSHIYRIPYPVSCIRHAASFLSAHAKHPMCNYTNAKGFSSLSSRKIRTISALQNFHIICIEVQADSYLKVTEISWLTALSNPSGKELRLKFAKKLPLLRKYALYFALNALLKKYML